MALSPPFKEITCVKQLLKELGHDGDAPVAVFDDSEPAIATAMGTHLSRRSRSIRTAHHNARDCVGSGLMTLLKVSGKCNPADMLTKPSSNDGHGRCSNQFHRKKRH